MSLTLPHELLCHILARTSLRTLYTASRCSHAWRAAANEQRDRQRALELVRTSALAENGTRHKIHFPGAVSILPPPFAASSAFADEHDIVAFFICEQKAVRRIVHTDRRGLQSPFTRLLLPRPLRGTAGPSGCATHMQDGSLYFFIADSGRDVICIAEWRAHDAAGGAPALETAPDALSEFGSYGSGPGELIAPGDLCISSGLLFVAEAHGISAFPLAEVIARHRRANVAPRYVATCSHKWGRRGSSAGEFKGGVGGLAATPDGELFVCDPGNHRIQVFRGADGGLLRTFGVKGDAPGHFRKPVSLTTLSRERLVVGEVRGRRLQVLSHRGEPLQLVSIGGTGGPPAPVTGADEDDEDGDDEQDVAAEDREASLQTRHNRVACFALDEGRGRLYGLSMSAEAVLHVFAVAA